MFHLWCVHIVAQRYRIVVEYSIFIGQKIEIEYLCRWPYNPFGQVQLSGFVFDLDDDLIFAGILENAKR